MENKGAVFVIVATLLVLVAIWFLMGVRISMGTEQVNYTVIEELGGGVEIRQYEGNTFISADAGGSNSGFRILSGYIFGKNEQNTKIAMTAPVISRQDGDVMHMSFVLPEGYDSKNAPTPMDDDILIHDVPPRKLVAIKFSGYVTDSKIESHRAILEEKISENGLDTKGEVFLMRYNPPWVPPLIMKNELAVEIE
ncbi:SOUL family heme-binding protein [Methanococcoides methylutens]|uniref:SOUL family heme-binding protein n=1 Tax=Methanococcoides methylutens TaxID=2226 RepID=UPI0009DE0C3E|nr:heme-binding protein [Methanococcoides methylutens]